ncbi:MAG TPA: ChbG/HpnK family deacetylase, partial [Acidimicrobiales bacterium]|nr:ChbG/HpnK family deacetylase [Acidimicrobiales bacterium]
MPTLAERLGHPPDARLLIVNCDDLGKSHASNVGVYQALREGVATSASLMVPCPWAREAAARYRGEDVGVHLTLNAEHDLYRWGPITHAPSLLDGDGGFPRTLEDVWDHADVDEVRRECRAQIERAIYWGFDVSHLDSHLAALELRPEFFDVYMELAVEFRLPVRLGGADTERAAGFPLRQLAADEGLVFPDHFVRVRGVGSRRAVERAL